MARDRSLRPLIDEELEEFGKLREQREEIRKDLPEYGVDVSGWEMDDEDDPEPGESD